MNDDEVLRSLGKAARDNRDAAPSAAEKALEGSLDGDFEAQLFAKLGIAEARGERDLPMEGPRSIIPFPPNRARSMNRVVAGLGLTFAAAAALMLVQRGSVEPLGRYELSAMGERLERGSEAPSTSVATATVGRPLTLVLRPVEKSTAKVDVRVFGAFGSVEKPWDAKVESSSTGAMRVTVVPMEAGEGELRVRLSRVGSAANQGEVMLTQRLQVREAP